MTTMHHRSQLRSSGFRPLALWLLALCLSAFPAFSPSAFSTVQSLDVGGWFLAMDPLRRGETFDWHKPPADWNRAKPAPGDGWDSATVPHCWTMDARFGEYTGVMWYRRSFLPKKPGAGETEWQLTFGAVGERCRVWLNGRDLGAHDSVGVPVSIDVTSAIEPGKQNYLAVAVDNSWDTTTIPGARAGTRSNDQLYPWLNYGGLLGVVRLESLPAARVDLQKINAAPSGPGSARVDIALWPGSSGLSKDAIITIDIVDPKNPGNPIATKTLKNETSVTFALTGVKNWTLADRQLYESRVTVRTPSSAHTNTATFGIRDIRIADAKFLLNGEPVYLAGANRARGHPKLGGISTPEAVAIDLQLMADAGMRFARLQHHPVNRQVLDWADRNGMLIIVEYPSWGMPADDLARPEIQARFKAGFLALMRESWNHPSVVGWSVGNEYECWLPAGVAWTKQMYAFVKQHDATRPVTFAALGRPLRILREKQQPASTFSMNYVDFICSNIYFKPDDVPGFLDPLHETWPDKPVLITEYGLRADRVKSEQDRLDHFDKMFAIVRARPWVCGFSYWAFNDYPSRYPGTGSDGYRRWGLVDENRKPRALYDHLSRELKNSGWEKPAVK